MRRVRAARAGQLVVPSIYLGSGRLVVCAWQYAEATTGGSRAGLVTFVRGLGKMLSLLSRPLLGLQRLQGRTASTFSTAGNVSLPARPYINFVNSLCTLWYG